MNKQRRKTLNEALELLDCLNEAESTEDASGLVKRAIDSVERCADDENMAFDSMPEQLKYSSSGDIMSENISDLQNACSDLELVIDSIEDMNIYDYGKISLDVDKVYNSIKDVIDR